MATSDDGQRAATISLVAGALGLTLVPLVGAVVALVAGHLARRLLPVGAEGRRRATVGLWLGYLGLAAPLALIVLGGDATQGAGVEAACRRALSSGADLAGASTGHPDGPFAACSLLIGDASLAAAFRRLEDVPPAERLRAWSESVRGSALCRPPPQAFCEADDGAPSDQRRARAVEAFVTAAGPRAPALREALEAGLSRHLP